MVEVSNDYTDKKMIHYYKTTIQYDGTGYAGFQWQNGIPTIQNDFNLAIKTILTGKVTTMGASRTDSGVHALEQVVKISSQNPINCTSFVMEINKIFPSQIRCLNIVPCHWDFKPASDPIYKEYRYYFTNFKNIPLPNDRRFISNFSMPLDMKLISHCVQNLLGPHDFCNFTCTGSNVKSTVREILFCELLEINPQTIFANSELFTIPKNLTSTYQLKIIGNGFLKQMIRNIISALWIVGSGKLNAEEFIKLLNGPKNEKRLWKVAPPNGLFLYQIKYPK